MITYSLKVTYADKTGAMWSKLTREKLGELVSRNVDVSGQFYDIPETVTIIRERGTAETC